MDVVRLYTEALTNSLSPTSVTTAKELGRKAGSASSPRAENNDDAARVTLSTAAQEALGIALNRRPSEPGGALTQFSTAVAEEAASELPSEILPVPNADARGASVVQPGQAATYRQKGSVMSDLSRTLGLVAAVA